MLQARGIVGHDVGVAWEVGSLMAVAVSALVQAGHVACGCCWSFRGHRPFLNPANCWGVVTARLDGGTLDRVMVSHCVELPHYTCVF